MNKEEILEFLELPKNSTENEIQVRLEEKLAYFTLLSENAPNDFLRKLHITNTKKVQDIQIQLFSASPVSNQLLQSTSESREKINDTVSSVSLQGKQNNSVVEHSQETKIVAWLVRHTENQSTKTFPLYNGKNYVGRNSFPGNHSIMITEDPYISRIHSLLYVTNDSPLEIIISDGAIAVGGKPSKNGVYINGDENRIKNKTVIGIDDTIQIGMTKFIIKPNDSNLDKIVKEVDESEYLNTVVIDIF